MILNIISFNQAFVLKWNMVGLKLKFRSICGVVCVCGALSLPFVGTAQAQTQKKMEDIALDKARSIVEKAYIECSGKYLKTTYTGPDGEKLSYPIVEITETVLDNLENCMRSKGLPYNQEGNEKDNPNAPENQGYTKNELIAQLAMAMLKKAAENREEEKRQQGHNNYFGKKPSSSGSGKYYVSPSQK